MLTFNSCYFEWLANCRSVILYRLWKSWRLFSISSSAQIIKKKSKKFFSFINNFTFVIKFRYTRHRQIVWNFFAHYIIPNFVFVSFFMSCYDSVSSTTVEFLNRKYFRRSKKPQWRAATTDDWGCLNYLSRIISW